MAVTYAELYARYREKAADDLMRRGYKVKARAQLLLSGAGGDPKRIDTGRLRGSIYVEQGTRGRYVSVRVGTNVRYAMLVHNGTGIYGPYHRPITPKTYKQMRFRRYGKVNYASSVKGMRRNQFLKKALSAAKD